MLTKGYSCGNRVGRELKMDVKELKWIVGRHKIIIIINRI